MSQTSPVLVQNGTGLAFRTQLNQVIPALGSDFSGASAPTDTFAGMRWRNTSDGKLYLRSEDNTAWNVDTAYANIINPASVVFTGGTINGVAIGGTSPSSAKFTTVNASGQITSTVATGASPFIVASTTPVANLSIGGNAATATSSTKVTGATWEFPGPSGTSKASFGGVITNTITTLKTCAKTGPQFIRTLGYFSPGDGGGDSFYLDASDTTSADNGVTVIVATDGGRWKSLNPTDIDVRRAGAKLDGIADDSDALQGAINALPPLGGTVRICGGVCRITRTINIGNGAAGGGGRTSKNAIKLIGNGAGFALYGAMVPVQIIYDGPTISGPMFNLNGLISDCVIEGMYLLPQGKCGGIGAVAFTGCRFKDLKIVGMASNCIGLALLGGPPPPGNYNTFNIFENVNITCTTPNSIGMYVDTEAPGVSGTNDTWLSQWRNCRFDVISGATNATCVWLRFTDSCSWYRCHVDNRPEPTAKGLVFDATSSDSFPAGMAFYDCSIKNCHVIEDATHHIRTNYFHGFGTYDDEAIPTHPCLIGVTDTGVVFGKHFGFNNKKLTDVNVQNTTTNTSVFSYSVPAYFLGGGDPWQAKNGMFKAKHFANYINNSGSNANLTITVSFGGTTLFSIPFTAIPSGATGRSVQLDFTMGLINNSYSAEVGQAMAVIGAVGSATGTLAVPFATLCGSNSSGGITIDTSTAKTLDISVQHSVANGNIAYTAKSTALELI